mgnify:CR=1 FL=1
MSSTTPKKFSPFSVNELIPLKGFLWKVTEADATTLRLQVYDVTKAGKEKGYRLTYKDPLELEK